MEYSRVGFVTFADIMGWKGIWLREEPKDVLNKMLEITNTVSDRIAEIKKELQTKNLDLEMDIHLISDTFVITSSFNEPKRGVDVPLDRLTVEFNKHGEIIQLLLKQCLDNLLLIRGATTYGGYEFQGSTFIGPAIDEAASWHEKANEVAVFITPSAYMIVENRTVDDTIWMNRKPVMKAELSHTMSVCWKDEENIIKYKEIMDKNKPITPDIAPKYMNTLGYLNED